ncbi:MAG: hypothetical protein FWC36_06790 [Spirochaetes bacterium]|nr:hypothetical protein [Spirochaetota bacterium]
MRKYFILGLLWELLRFSILFFSMQRQAESSFILWIFSQQLIIFYLYLFLWYNTDKYCHYLKIVIAAKALGIFTGIAYLIKMVYFTQDLFFQAVFTANILLMDTIIMIFMIYLAKKYFTNFSREECK